MTVIASYNYLNCGIIIGDILLSGPISDSTYSGVDSPSLERTTQNFCGWGARGFRQKIYIINDKCAIAWSGAAIYAHDFISRLIKLSKSNRIVFTKNIIERAFNKYKERDEFSVVGVIYDDQLEAHTFGFGCDLDNYHSNIFGEVYCSGSGKQAIKDYTDKLAEEFVSQINNDDDDVAAQGAAYVLHQVALLLNAEYRQGDIAASILEYFGGGYEIAIFYDGKFRKISARYMFYDVSIDENDLIHIHIPKVVITQNYINGVIHYRSIETLDDGEYNPCIIKDRQVKVEAFAGLKVADNTDNSTLFNCCVLTDNFKFYGKELVSCIQRSEIDAIESFVYRDELGKNRLFLRHSNKFAKQLESFMDNAYRT